MVVRRVPVVKPMNKVNEDQYRNRSERKEYRNVGGCSLPTTPVPVFDMATLLNTPVGSLTNMGVGKSVVSPDNNHTTFKNSFKKPNKEVDTTTLDCNDRSIDIYIWPLLANLITAGFAFTFCDHIHQFAKSCFAQYIFLTHAIMIAEQLKALHLIHKNFNLSCRWVELALDGKVVRPNGSRYPQRLFFIFLDIPKGGPGPTAADFRRFAEFIAEYVNNLTTSPCLDRDQRVRVPKNFLKPMTTRYSDIMLPDQIPQLIRPRLPNNIVLNASFYANHLGIFESLYTVGTMTTTSAQLLGAPYVYLTPDDMARARAAMEEHIRLSAAADNAATNDDQNEHENDTL